MLLLTYVTHITTKYRKLGLLVTLVAAPFLINRSIIQNVFRT